MNGSKKRPFYPASKSPVPNKVSNQIVVKTENTLKIPKLDFHDRTLNLACHGPICNYKIERYTSMETRVLETLQDYDINYPCNVYIIPYSKSKSQPYIQTQNPLLNTASIIKNATQVAIEESLKTEKMIKEKEIKIATFKSSLLKRLSLEKLKKRIDTGK